MRQGDRLLLILMTSPKLAIVMTVNTATTGWESVLDECHQLPAIAQVNRLIEDICEFSSARPRSDDLTRNGD
jgi:hypothetical protein